MREALLAALLAGWCAPALAGGLPAGVRVLTLTGEIRVEKVRPGDTVLSFSDEGLVQVKVRETSRRKTRLFRIRTSKGTLRAAHDHPLLTRFDFSKASALKAGDDVAVLRDGRRVWARVRSVKLVGETELHTLELDPPHTFIADGFIVHNYRRRRYGVFDLVFLGVVFVVFFIKEQFNRTAYGRRGGAYRGVPAYHPPSPRGMLPQDGLPERRAALTLGILEALGRRDPAFNPVELEAFTRKAFTKVKAAAQARDYYGARGLMMPRLFAEHSALAESMRVRGQVNMLEDLRVLGVDFVHVRCPRQQEGRSYTALVTYSVKDYMVEEKTNYGPGGAEPATRPQAAGASVPARTFQEYWTFNQLGGNWALARIDQPGEMDFLNAPNQPDTPQGAEGVPLAAAAPAAPADRSAYMPPSARPAAPAAEDPFERGAALLRGEAPEAAPQPADARPAPPAVNADLWNRQKMEIAATLAFENVYEAWGGNDPARLTGEFVSAEALARLKAVMEARKTEGLTFEFKSLFTRRAEIVLSSPAAKSKLHLDEFTARISATAVRAISRKGKVLHRDEAPEPFTEYWVFGRQDKAWKLRDILPRMDHEADRTQDGAPGPAQIEWYWHS